MSDYIIARFSIFTLSAWKKWVSARGEKGKNHDDLGNHNRCAHGACSLGLCEVAMMGIFSHMAAFGFGGLCAMIAIQIIRYRKDVKRWQTRQRQMRQR